MKRFTLLGAGAALLLGMVAFHGSRAVAGAYDDCYTPTSVCSGTCTLGTCTPTNTSLRPLTCFGGDKYGYRNNGGSCGQCLLMGYIVTGEGCGPALSGEPC